MMTSKIYFRFLFQSQRRFFSFLSVEKKKKCEQKANRLLEFSKINEADSTSTGMTHEEFRKYGKDMVDYIVDYLKTIQ